MLLLFYLQFLELNTLDLIPDPCLDLLQDFRFIVNTILATFTELVLLFDIDLHSLQDFLLILVHLVLKSESDFKIFLILGFFNHLLHSL